MTFKKTRGCTGNGDIHASAAMQAPRHLTCSTEETVINIGSLYLRPTVEEPGRTLVLQQRNCWACECNADWTKRILLALVCCHDFLSVFAIVVTRQNFLLFYFSIFFFFSCVFYFNCVMKVRALQCRWGRALPLKIPGHVTVSRT